MEWNAFPKSLFVALWCAGLAGTVLAQGPSGGEMSEALVQKWVQFMTPGPAHAQLEHRVGNWKIKLETRTAPGAEPTVFDATAEGKWAMGRRYVIETIKGNVGQVPFESLNITGYDNLKKKFVTVWIDNMGTGLMTGSGSYDDATKTYLFNILVPDVVTGDYKQARLVQRPTGADERVVEMYDTTPEGKEYVALKAVYHRAQ